MLGAEKDLDLQSVVMGKPELTEKEETDARGIAAEWLAQKEHERLERNRRKAQNQFRTLVGAINQIDESLEILLTKFEKLILPTHPIIEQLERLRSWGDDQKAAEKLPATDAE